MYQIQKFEHLFGTPGFSDNALKIHFKLYEGYVNNVNSIGKILRETETKSSGQAELRRRFGWEFDGMRLHEIYFSSFSKETAPLDTANLLYEKIEKDFGSFKNWQEDFTATALARGIGWAIVYYDEVGDRLFNTWVNEHDTGHLANAKILLLLDVFEHAFMLDYDTDRASYVDAFLKAVDWETIQVRF